MITHRTSPWTLALVALAACSGDGSSDIVGPFTGETQRYVVDSITIPRDSPSAQGIGDDLDGDGDIDNQLGAVSAVLATTMDLTTNAPDMIAAGALASSVEIQADDLTDDDRVGVTYFGADGDAAVVVGGRFVAGRFESNRSADTSAPGRANVRLPIFTNADPLPVELEGVEIDLDSDGADGFVATIRGGILKAVAADAAYAGLLQMIADEPQRHIAFGRNLDTDLDGKLSRDEFDNSVITLVIAPDIQMFDGKRYAPKPGSLMRDSVSIGFQVHLVPCPTGNCALGTPADRCRDRVRDGDETDVDCGGSCQPCQSAAMCSAPADCQTGACDAGHCRAPTCSDGVRDGLETDVDCGDNCAKCELGKVCVGGADCMTGKCDNAIGNTGVCVQ